MNFEFNPTQVTMQTPVEVDSHSFANALGTDQERISAARLKAIEWSKNSNPFGEGDSYWTDYAGPKSSHWDAERSAHIAELLETPILKTFKYEMGNHYDAKTGDFVSKTGVPFLTLSALKEAIKARCTELGISEPKLWEWLSVPDPDPNNDFGRKIYREDLATRIRRWQHSEI